MSNVQIPNLPAVASLSGEELFEGVQAGSSVKISLGQMIAATRTGTPTTIPLPVSAGGTGTTTSTGTGSVVLSDSPTLVTPIITLGTFGLGTVGAPSITFTGDTNTGIWSPGAETIAVSTSGAERMRINSAGNVGIGTTNPVTKLDIAAAGTLTARIWNTASNAVAGFDASNATGTGLFGVDATGVFTYTGTALPIRFSTNANERMRVHASGGVSIGNTTDPGATNLSVTGVGSFGLGTALLPSHTFNGDLNTGMWSPAADTVAFSTNGTERMRIDSAGVVGVGTTIPASYSTRLSVVGGNLGVSEEGATVTTTRSNANIGSLGAYNPTGASLAFRTAPSGSGEVERMRIHPTGGVSIGNTTDPGATNLSVTGVGSFGLGTALLPSVTFNGDTNTGIYSPGADTLSISTAGVQRLSVGATGDVSMLAVSTEDRALNIGANRSGDGNSFLDLIGDTTYTDYGTRLIRSGGANGSTSIQHRGTGGLLLVAQEAAAIVFSTSNTERFRVGAGGQWGIGGANFGTAGQAFISGGPSAAPAWGTLGLAGGGTGVTTAPAAAAVLMGYTTTATAAGTTVLTNTSSQYQLFTGTTTQTITLPVTSTLTTGWNFHIVNSSTGNLTINSSGGNLVGTVIPGTTAMVTCILASGTTAASWEFGVTDFNTLTGTGSVVMSVSPTLVTPTLGTGSFDLGAVGTPSITFTSDANTGIWSPAADTLAVSTNGTERLRIDSAGSITQPNAVSGSGAIVGEQVFRLPADGAAIGPTIADFFGPSSAVSLEASSVYEITIYAVFTKTTAGTATFTLTASSAPTRMVGTYQASPITGIAAGADTSGFAGSQGATTAAFAATGSLSTAVNHAYQFSVQVQTNAASSFRLQITQSLGTATPLAGSYYTVKKISATTGTFVA